MKATDSERFTLRQRRRDVFIGKLVKANETLQTKVKKIDIYGKIHDDYCVKSTSKSIVSLLLYIIVFFLTFHEIIKYFNGEVIDNIGVDNTINNKLDIKLDITFPSLRCEEVSVDTVDNVGENQVDAKDDMIKIPIDINGKEVHSVKYSEQNDNKIECMSCYGAETSEISCCNDCDSLKSAYRSKGWSYLEIVGKAPQCTEKVGCRVNGRIQVNKVSGNIHVALGSATIKNGKHVHEFNMNDISRGFNTSHIIHELKFGSDNIPSLFSPLENVEKIVSKGTKMFHYYVKLIPTQYFLGSNEIHLYGNQYAYTERERDVHVQNGELSGLPGIFIVYDFQPFLLQKFYKRIPVTHLFTSFCAIIGGIYSVMSLLDTILAWILKSKVNRYINYIYEINYSK
ncbi:ER vesicle protein Erv41p [Cryptosporidium canis]|uniref:ER vesicle protein Erv41p n=1 Tax=Cryptosporidium canis TaxID=195482 RepID=A0ABQ8P7P7_9CRYT|nr:ER vesicle protein Erv41p [Cryptosporidium canis]KAJ1614418.1 ER vesicle protein Erv41p [Cryptosporidium canis]